MGCLPCPLCLSPSFTSLQCLWEGVVHRSQYITCALCNLKVKLHTVSLNINTVHFYKISLTDCW